MNIFKELKKTMLNFIKPYRLEYELLKMPKSIKRLGIKIEILSLGMTIISLIFAFVLKYVNIMIEIKLILVGIILYMLYRGEFIIRNILNIYLDSEKTRFELIFDDEIIYKASNIIGKTQDKVLKYDENSGIYKIMSNESVLNSIKNYLRTLWNLQLKHRFDVISIISVIVMIFTAIFTNSEIPNYIFIPLIIIYCIISFLITAYNNFNRVSYYNKNRDYDNEQSVIVNDLLRVTPIVNQDLNMRIERFKNTVMNSNKNIKKYYKKLSINRLFTSIVETFNEYSIIIFYVLNTGLTNITVASIAEITALLVIVETVTRHIRSFVYTLERTSNDVIALEKEEEDVKLILDIYTSIINNKVKKVEENIILKPFTINYSKQSNNDIPFTLKLLNEIILKRGDVLVLYGPSGSGKSTFMNMLTERIKVENSEEIPRTSRFLFYDEKLKFGSLSLYDELFCDITPDLNKMEEILKNLNLWYEIETVTKDVWQYLKDKNFNNSLSNGQKQRLILAKILYFMDEEIDALVLDECTSGLDVKDDKNIDACNILEYIVRFANKDKKRIIIISTHQNIDEFKENINKDFNVRNLVFEKEKESSTIKIL